VLALGVPELPVGREAAQTYLALKAAGFEPVPVWIPRCTGHAKAPCSRSRSRRTSQRRRRREKLIFTAARVADTPTAA